MFETFSEAGKKRITIYTLQKTMFQEVANVKYNSNEDVSSLSELTKNSTTHF